MTEQEEALILGDYTKMMHEDDLTTFGVATTGNVTWVTSSYLVRHLMKEGICASESSARGFISNYKDKFKYKVLGNKYLYEKNSFFEFLKGSHPKKHNNITLGEKPKPAPKKEAQPKERSFSDYRKEGSFSDYRKIRFTPEALAILKMRQANNKTSQEEEIATMINSLSRTIYPEVSKVMDRFLSGAAHGTA